MNGKRYKYGFNGKEKDNETYGEGNAYDFGARIYDSRLGRWLSLDPAFRDYASISPYVGFGNNPFVFIDPDGERLYFVGGANNDQDGWNYINRFKNIFTSKGIEGFTRINASGGKIKDIAFTASYKNFSHVGQHIVKTDKGLELKLKRRDHVQITKAVNVILADLKANPLKDGEQLNLAGYSYGSVLQAHVALRLADQGIKVNNLILVGSPISDKSELYKALTTNENICKVIRHDIKGDKLSNPQSEKEFIEGGKQNSTDTGPHFDLARPGAEADKKIGELGDKLKTEGVK
ncbi:MAG: RHS repeat-associated core domain-containing protein [Bacteroidota bacterium]|nr:RHS repeat-associated core domain-containing protein [Bacteroidota bacterium]